MGEPKSRRQRGVILTPTGLERWQTAIYHYESTQNRGQRYTLEELGDQIRIAPKTVAKAMDRQVKIDRRTLELCFKAFGLELQARDYEFVADASAQSTSAIHYPNSLPLPEAGSHHQDWGEMPDVSFFYGRTQELDLLHRWIVPSKPTFTPLRLLAVVGQGGVGKTTLTAKLVQQLQPEFEFVFWRSLRNAPPLQTILQDLVKFLSDQQDVNSDLLHLLDLLRRSSCLIILDNLETLFQSGQPVGRYQPGYENYGELFKLIGETTHASCLIVTSREKPLEVAELEGVGGPVRCLELGGSAEAARAICRVKDLQGTDQQQAELGERYSDNPLVIKIVATLIHDWFGSDIGQFLQQETLMFSNIKALLNQQFDRLSQAEQAIMYWLAVNRSWTSIAELEADLVPPMGRKDLLEALGALRWRNLIEQQTGQYTQQSVVMEYVCDRLIEQVCTEIQSWSPPVSSQAPASQEDAIDATHSHSQVPQQLPLFQTHALLKVTADSYIQASQIRLILQPIADRLLAIYGSRERIEQQARAFLVAMHQNPMSLKNYMIGNLIDLCAQLEISLAGCDFSGFPVWQADLRRGSLQHANFRGANFSKVSVFIQNFGTIVVVAFSPDGQQLATGGSRGGVMVWNATEVQLDQQLKSHISRISALAWSPDGQRLASGSADSTVCVWQVSTGNLLHVFQHNNLVRSLCWSPNGQIIASGSDDRSVRYWHAETGTPLQVLYGHQGGVWALQFSPDGRLLASGGADKTIRLWQTETGQTLRKLRGHQSNIWSIQFSPDGRLLASGGDDKTVRLWDAATGKPQQVLMGHTSWIWSLAWNQVGTLLASAGEDEIIRVWDRTGRTVQQLQGHKSGIWSISWSVDGQLASGGEDQTIRLWDVQRGQLLKTIQGYAAGIWCLACQQQSPDSTDHQFLLASGCEDGAIRIWHGSMLIQEPTLGKVLRGHTHRVWSLAWQPREGEEASGLLASASEAGSIWLWDVDKGRALKQLQAHDDRIWELAWKPTEPVLASASQDKTIKLWEMKSGRWLKTLQGHTAGVVSVQFSPNGQWLASGSEDATIRLWEVKTGQLIHTFKGHQDRVMAVRFSPDGNRLASASFDQTIRLWQLSTGTAEAVWRGHTNQLWTLEFSPDGLWLASAGQDQLIRIWRVGTEQSHVTLVGHRGLITTLVWTPDSQLLASGSEDETIRVWSISGECLYTIEAEQPYKGMNIAGVTGLTEAAIANLQALGAVQQ